MDFVPLTLFFVACLNFQGNVMGNPAPAIFSNQKREIWPKSCKGKFYCQELIKPAHFPSDKDIESMYFANKEVYDRVLEHYGTNATEDRTGDKNICRQYGPYPVEKVAMIIDVNNKLRYTLHIPGKFEMSIATRDCHEKATEHLESIYKDAGIVCIQKTQQFPFVVLKPDMSDLEIVRIKEFNTFCSPVKSKMATTIKY